MDPVSTLLSVCKVAAQLTHWLDATKEKEQTLLDIAATVSRIYDILSSLQAPEIATTLDNNFLGAIRGIGDALNRTKDHLVVWRERKLYRVISLFVPSTATNELRNDERLLTNQLIIALFSMGANNYIRGNRTPDDEMRSLVLSSIRNQDVKAFWRDYVGAKILFVPSDSFRIILKLWFRDVFGQDLSGSICDQLVLRIDEFAIGGVTPASLESFIGGRGLWERMLPLTTRDAENVSQIAAPTISQKSSLLRPPLLIWVDDNRIDIATYVSFARRRGITVVELPSTALAKAWIEENLDFLRQNDTPNRIRVISDNARLEEDDSQVGTFLNLSAGESLLRYLRGEFLNMPVLIYCCGSIKQTNYIHSFKLAGSTTSGTVCMNYISALADGISHDRGWRKFRA